MKFQDLRLEILIVSAASFFLTTFLVRPSPTPLQWGILAISAGAFLAVAMLGDWFSEDPK